MMRQHFYRGCRIFLAFGILFICQTVSAADAYDAPVPPALAGKGYHLVKNWDFSTNIKDLDALGAEFFTRYSSGKNTGDHLGHEWERYRENNNHIISDGVLHLVARAPASLVPGAIESGMIRSRWTGEYGYWEARMKVPRGAGLWPAFWFSNEWWPPEIDVMEIINTPGYGTKASFHALHGKYQGKTLYSILDQHNSYRPPYDFADGFHTFAVEWTPTTVSHYVDNVLVVSREFQWRHDGGQDGGPVGFAINLAVGGDWPGPPASLSEFPASLDVAWIHIWQK